MIKYDRFTWENKIFDGPFRIIQDYLIPPAFNTFLSEWKDIFFYFQKEIVVFLFVLLKGPNVAFMHVLL